MKYSKANLLVLVSRLVLHLCSFLSLWISFLSFGTTLELSYILWVISHMYNVTLFISLEDIDLIMSVRNFF